MAQKIFDIKWKFREWRVEESMGSSFWWTDDSASSV